MLDAYSLWINNRASTIRFLSLLSLSLSLSHSLFSVRFCFLYFVAFNLRAYKRMKHLVFSRLLTKYRIAVYMLHVYCASRLAFKCVFMFIHMWCIVIDIGVVLRFTSIAFFHHMLQFYVWYELASPCHALLRCCTKTFFETDEEHQKKIWSKNEVLHVRRANIDSDPSIARICIQTYKHTL